MKKPVQLKSRISTYFNDVFVHESGVLGDLRRRTEPLPGSSMMSAPLQGQLLAFLVQLVGAKRVLELGTYTGYGTLWMASSLPDDGCIVTCEIDSECLELAQAYWRKAGVIPRIELIRRPALDVLDTLLSECVEPFDLIYLDADKREYPECYERSLMLLRPGGLLVVDNVVWGGKVADPAALDPETCAIRELNGRARSDHRVSMCMIPVRDGLLLVRKRAASPQRSSVLAVEESAESGTEGVPAP